MICRTLIFFLFQLLLWATPQGLQAQVDPQIQWNEIETEDAYWLFDAKHQEIAEYYIMQFQRAKAQVLPLFKESPRKMTILLIDNTDMANGSAQVTPHPIITLYMVHPTAQSSIGEFKDQIHELLVHEYTHILNMEPVNGWIRPFYWIFGSTAHPNMMLPRWYTEGLAVYTESALSGTGGRLNSQYVEGLARSLTLEEKWEDYPLSQLNDYHPDWLGASRAYIFGGILMDSIAQEGDEDIIYKMNHSFSRRIPYLLDGVLLKHLGRDFNQQLDRAYSFWMERSQKQIEAITSSPIIMGDKLVTEDRSQDHSPSISPDGLWMAYLSDDLKGRGHIYTILRHPRRGFRGYKPVQVETNTQAQSISWHPTASGFVYEKIERHQRYYRFYDLYFYDLNLGKSRRLTRGLRAHHACFSPRGETLYFLANAPASKKIMSMDWKSQEVKTIYEAGIGEDLRYLSCPEADSLIFIEHLPGRAPHITRLGLIDKAKRVIFDKYPVSFLKLTHKGAVIGSKNSGVENLYRLDHDNMDRPQGITNTLTRTLQGDLDPLDDGLYYAQMSAQGSGIFYLNGAQWESLADDPPKVETIVSYPTAQGSESHQDASQGDSSSPYNTSSYPSRKFSAWRYMLPNHWIPFMYIIPGGQLYQAMTSAGDPLGVNSMSLVGQWDTLTRKPGVSLSYMNNSLPVSLGGAVSDIYNYFFNTGTTLHFTNAQFISSYRFDSKDIARIVFRWKYSQLDLNNNIFLRQGPQLDFTYNKVKMRPNDISASSGWRLELGHRQFLSDLGNVAYGESLAHVGTYWSSFTPERHVLYTGVHSSYAPQLANSFFATSTLAGPFLNPQITNTSFIQRGYPTGVFVARNIVTTNVEYRFPMGDIFRGWTQPPLFLKNLQGHLVFDATSLDGIYSNSALRQSQGTEFGRWFTGYGIEFESNVQVGFHVPITLTLGFYYGQEEQAFGGFNTFFNIRL
jgi:hypothetical protein